MTPATVMMLWEDPERREESLRELIAQYKATDQSHEMLAVQSVLGAKRSGVQLSQAAAVCATKPLVSSIKPERVGYQDRDGDGAKSAFVMPFINAINQSRLMAFDGRYWYVQANKHARFKPVGVAEIPEQYREAMFWFILSRRCS